MPPLDYQVVLDTTCDPLRLEEPFIVYLTDETVTLKIELNRTSTAKIIEIGGKLQEAKEQLENCWRLWLDNVGIAKSTAYNYLKLKKWYDLEPAVVDSWSTLGPSKLYELASTEVSKRQTILTESNREMLEGMTFQEFREYLSPTAPAEPAPPGTAICDGLDSFDRHLDSYRDEVGRVQDPAIRDLIRSKAMALSQELQEFILLLDGGTTFDTGPAGE